MGVWINSKDGFLRITLVMVLEDWPSYPLIWVLMQVCITRRELFKREVHMLVNTL